jgi:general transcription factor 3C polypeptide 3 (transcription factor C subunit 4)
LKYKELIEGGETEMQEEAKMKVSKIYDSTGNIDMALEYALQIGHAYTEEDFVERHGKQFFKKKSCMQMRSILYKSMLLLNSEVLRERDMHFINNSKALITAFLGNRFIFEKRRKKKERGEKHLGLSSLIGKREYESDYFLLQEIEGLDVHFVSEGARSPEEAAYFDALLSLLHGLTVDEWLDFLKNYVYQLYHTGNYSAALLLIKKSVSAEIIRRTPAYLLSLLLIMARIASETEDMQNLVFAISHIFSFSSKRLWKNKALPSLYFLTYFLVGTMPLFYTQKEFYVFQKNVQRNTRRKFLRSFDPLLCTTVLAFSYMPSFIYTETIKKIESISRKNTRGESLLHISRDIALASIFLTYGSSRKVLDRSRYIGKGISRMIRGFRRLSRDGSEGDTPGESVEDFAYEEGDKKETRALLAYNIGRAYHQYKLFGEAERYYKVAMKTRNRELKKLAAFNLSLIYGISSMDFLKEHYLNESTR